MTDLLFKNVKAVNPSNDTVKVCDILVKDGVIAQIGGNIEVNDVKIIEASGLTLIPGLVDIHTHLRDPGFTDKEDIITGANAAAAGGVTTLFCMPNTKPAVDSEETVKYIIDKAKDANASVIPVAAVTKGLSGEELTDMCALKAAGAGAFSDDGVPVKTAELMRKALDTATELNLPVFAHCEDKSLSKKGIINEGVVSEKLGCEGIPNSAEDVGTAREISLLMSAKKGARLHICHVSTEGSVNLIRFAKSLGLNITAETGPHYFIFNEEKVFSRDADYRMNPPLRSENDRLAVLKAVCDGTIDCIATDHAPHTPSEKSDFYTAPNGVIGMETSFSASYTALVKTGLLSVLQLVKIMSYNPAKIAGADGGTLDIGSRADVVLIDENEKWTVDPLKLHGKSKNCVFKGAELQSKVKMTVLGGRIVYNELFSEV